MKRLIASLVFSLGLVMANVNSVAAVTRYWQLQMFDPAVTTSRTINIEYKVASTIREDEFTVELLENGTSKEVRAITTDYGDSVVFSVALPATGTYTYKINATNSGDATTKTQSRTVQVADGPAPTVTTVFVNNAAADGGGQAGGGGGNAGGQGAGGAGAVGAAGANDAVGQADGNVAAANTEDAANTDNQAGNTDGSNNQGDVLGAEAAASTTKSSRGGLYTGLGALVLAAAAGSYYFLRIRPRNQ